MVRGECYFTLPGCHKADGPIFRLVVVSPLVLLSWVRVLPPTSTTRRRRTKKMR